MKSFCLENAILLIVGGYHLIYRFRNTAVPTDKIKYLIEHEAEGSLLDFKTEPYSLGKQKTYEFLKDLSSMANVLSDEDKYSIMGVEEKEGLAVGFKSITNTLDESNFQKYVTDNIEPDLQFKIKQVGCSGHNLVFIRVFGNTNRPYLFKKEIMDQTGKVKFRPGDGYIRKGSATTKIVRAHLDQIFSVKWQKKDRKEDLELICIVKPVKDLPQFDHIDVNIINKSNTSINFHVDVKIFKQDGLEVFPKYLIQRGLASNYEEVYSIQPSIGVFNEERRDHFLVGTALKKGVTVLQNYGLRNLLEENAIIVIQSEAMKIRCQIVVRSDEFTEGSLVQEVDFSVRRR
ncbi:ATP-binding protein [Dyadobacter sp. CY327]|uniref:AlbA family DNA-binding domain-containing protein n=1 Tax=Dyadobacter sp. CY327 TaxID=2907301 RepID=UPI001F257B3B|nr:RNA-binding domain-containing protein [Dyadobacter sp. CY327]MCE7070937.1 ATP-binding protein [Dyadobacter sp. CY327]